MRDLHQELAELKTSHRYRSRRISESAQGTLMRIDGREVINFCSNDYLGLANDPRVVQSFQDAANLYGVGAGSAHLINGHSKAHHELEERIASWTGREAALLFSTGYMANLAVLSALLSKHDRVFEDKLNHASLIDAGLLSGADFSRYLHGDCSSLEKKLTQNHDGETLIVTDGVFSMDGDMAPIKELSSVAKKNNAWLMIDDAHGFGVLGKNGAGSCEWLNLSSDDVPILMGTLGKALGTAGAFIAGDGELIDYLIQKARPYIYTTAMPAAIAAATITSIHIAASETDRRERLEQNIKQFKQGIHELGLNLMPSETAIQPVIIGDDKTTLKLSTALWDAGFHVSAIRPPTVPKGSSRLRFTLNASHQAQQIDDLLSTLAVIVTK